MLHRTTITAEPSSDATSDLCTACKVVAPTRSKRQEGGPEEKGKTASSARGLEPATIGSTLGTTLGTIGEPHWGAQRTACGEPHWGPHWEPHCGTNWGKPHADHIGNHIANHIGTTLRNTLGTTCGTTLGTPFPRSSRGFSPRSCHSTFLSYNRIISATGLSARSMLSPRSNFEVQRSPRA